MSYAPSLTVDEILERKYEKFRQYFLQKASFLAIVRPVAWLATLAGISGVSVNCENGQYFAKVSSEFTLRYSYIILAYSIFYETSALYYYYQEYTDTFLFLYLATRAAVDTAIHVSMLLHRKEISKLLQREHDFGARIPALIAALPIVSYILMCCTSVLSAQLVQNTTAAVLKLVGNIRPPMFNVYGCFLCICHAAFFVDSIRKVNFNIQMFGKTRPKCPTLRPIMKQYMALRHLCCTLNDAMGMVMLLTSVTICCEIVYCLFMSCMSNDLVVVAFSVTWSLLHMVSGISATLAWQQVETTYNETISVVKELQLRTTFTNHTQIRKEAQELQIQLKQTRLSFSASGWFVLNGGQLQTAVATVITYTVILVQNMDLRLEELIQRFRQKYEA